MTSSVGDGKRVCLTGVVLSKLVVCAETALASLVLDAASVYLHMIAL